VSVRVIAELHPLRSSRIKLTVSPKSVAGIISDLNSGFPLSQARVCRNGEIVKDFSVQALDGDFIAVKFVPYGSNEQTGGLMKVGGWVLAVTGAALIATGYGAGFGGMLIGAGLGMAMGGTVLMNIDIPKLNDPEKPDSDPSIRGGKNQARPHGRIPVLFGRHRLYPDLAANPHTSVIGGQQYLTQLFCGGYSDCVIDIDSFKLGETPLVKFSQTKDINEILSGNDSLVSLEIMQNGEVSKLYPCCVHEEAVNALLQNQIEDEDGNKIPGEIERETPDNTDMIDVDIFLYNGIGKYDDKGKIGTAEVEVRARYKEKDGEKYSLLGYFTDGGNKISGAELTTKRYHITKSGLKPAKYTVKVERVTPDPEKNDSKTIDQVHLGSIRSFKSVDKKGNPVYPIRPERQKNLTVIALRVMATGKLNGVIDSFNYVATSKLPVYSGAGTGPLYWLEKAESRNPASALLYALRGAPAQESVDPDNIDWASFEDFYLWCEKHSYTCNAYLSESVTIAEILKMIGAAARAEILRIDSKISVVQDIERPSHMGLFTPKNSINYSVTMMRADIPDAIALRYIDEESGYTQNELQVYNTPDGSRADEPKKIQKVDLWGVTDSGQANRIGMYNYAVLKNRPFIHTIELDIEYLTCNKGDWIQYAGDIALTGSSQGRVAGLVFDDNICVGIRADEPVAAEPGKQYAVRIRKSDGSVALKDVAAVGHPDIIYFSEPFKRGDMPREGDIYAFGIRGHEVIDLIITGVQPQANFTAVLTCVEYSPEIYRVDDPDFILPEFENRITPVSGAVDSGVVGTSKWRLFLTFHDSEEEPPRPEGAGQNGGWHYAQTQRSVWQSSKTEESAGSGTWCAPVRIKNFRSGEDTVPVYLTLSPQSVILDCDGNGGIRAGLLPFTSQASLYKWNVKLPTVAGIQRFPGTGGALFDPVLGDLVPTKKGTVFTLENAPRGAGIDYDGKITVSENAELDGEHYVTVKAQYEGAVYSSVLFIQVKKRTGEEKYMGTVEELPVNSPDIFIVKGRILGNIRALPGQYVLTVAGGTAGAHTWEAGGVYQWSGIAWEYRKPEDYTELYLSCYKDGLEVLELARNTGWFGALIAKLLIAQKAFIEELQTQIITLKEKGLIQSGVVDPLTNEPLFVIKANGEVTFNKATVRGNVYAEDGHFTKVTGEKLSIQGGTINIGPLFVSDDKTKPSGTEIIPGSKRLVEFVNDNLPGTPAVGSSITSTRIIYYGGKYDSDDLYSIKFTKEWRIENLGGSMVNFLYYRAEFNIGSGKIIKVETFVQNNSNPQNNSTTIGKQITIYGGGEGMTFQLKDLPSSDPHEKGKLYYNNPTGQLFVSL
jgi:hypothetical protein